VAIKNLVTWEPGNILCAVDRASIHHIVNETNLVHNLFSVYFVNFIYDLYMFRTYPGTSWGGITAIIRHLVFCYSVQLAVCCADPAHQTAAQYQLSYMRCGNKETGLLLLLISGQVDDEEEGRALTRGLPSTVTQRFIHAHQLVWLWPLLEADRVSGLRRNNAEC